MQTVVVIAGEQPYMVDGRGPEALGRLLREARKRTGRSQEAVAAAAGVDLAHISRIENAKVGVSETTLIAIAQQVDVRPLYALYVAEFLDEATYRMLLAMIPAISDAFMNDLELTPAQKRGLLAVYSGMIRPLHPGG